MVERLGSHRVCEGCGRRTRWERMASMEIVIPEREHPFYSGPWCFRCSSEYARWLRVTRPSVKIYFRAV
jgi:predicted Fe-S protein YdhL (DUF1289 family)